MGYTIFTTCRPFDGEFAIIQHNAIKSWTMLNPRPEILLIGKEEGTQQTAKELGCRWIRAVERNRWDTPLVSSLFWVALTQAENDVLAYVNSDVIMVSDFAKSVDSAASRFDVFLMIGPRWDLEVKEKIDFASEWERKILKNLSRFGQRHKPTGCDYFVFTFKTLMPDTFPPIAVGRTAWDAWLIWHARKRSLPTIDASMTITAIHQMHEKGGKTYEKGINRAIVDSQRKIDASYVWDADLRMYDRGLKRNIIERTQTRMDAWCEETGWIWR